MDNAISQIDAVIAQLNDVKAVLQAMPAQSADTLPSELDVKMPDGQTGAYFEKGQAEAAGVPSTDAPAQ